jgi:hypothetical protein
MICTKCKEWVCPTRTSWGSLSASRTSWFTFGATPFSYCHRSFWNERCVRRQYGVYFTVSILSCTRSLSWTHSLTPLLSCTGQDTHFCPVHHSCIPVFRYSRIPVFLYSCIPLFLYSFIPVFLYSCIPVFLYFFFPLFLFSFIPLFLYFCIPVFLFLYSFIPSFLYSFISLFPPCPLHPPVIFCALITLLLHLVGLNHPGHDHFWDTARVAGSVLALLHICIWGGESAGDAARKR